MNSNQFLSESEETTEAAFALIGRVLEEMSQVVFQRMLEEYGFNLERLQDTSPVTFDFANILGERCQQAIYPILESNLEQLNDDFVPLLEKWVSTVLPTQEITEQREFLAYQFALFCELLMKFPKGNQASNLEIAIAGYKSILQFFPIETHLEQWIGLQGNLSIAYRTRIRGDKAENIELAIKYGEEALNKCTSSKNHRELLWRELATTYRHKSYQNQDPVEQLKNLKKSINYCNQALQIFTPENSLKDWAIIQGSLGNTYSALYVLTRNNKNNSDESEEYFRLAVSSLEKALQGFPLNKYPQEWGIGQSNLGILYLERISDNIQKERKQAFKLFKQALFAHSREQFPYDWATTKYHLGLVYQDLNQLPQAMECFESALEICQPTLHPQDCIRAGRNLGSAAFTLGLWDKAITGYTAAIEAIETSRSWTVSESRRQEILAENIGIYDKIVQTYINNNQLAKALEYVERSRSRRLVDLITTNDVFKHGEIPTELAQLLNQYESIQQQINAKYRPQSNGNREFSHDIGSTKRDISFSDIEEINQLVAQKQEIWQAIRQKSLVFAEEIQVNPLSLQQIQQLIDSDTTAILSFYTTDERTHIFVLRRSEAPQLLTCEGQGFKPLQKWIEQNWLSPYEEAKRKGDFFFWLDTFNQFLTELSKRLQITTLVANHLNSIEELIIIPHLYLHQIPFAALPLNTTSFPNAAKQKLSLKSPEEGNFILNPKIAMGGKSSEPESFQEQEYLGDKFRIRVLPSCQILNFCYQRPQFTKKPQMGLVEDASQDLPFTRYEGETIAKYYQIPAERRLSAQQATLTNYKQILERVQRLHSSHHASADLNNPLNSFLLLANGEQLSLAQLLSPSWTMPNLLDIFINCCETSYTITEITDDILTIATGFLCAGARSVVSTLWAVEDLASALLSIIYYENRFQGESRPQALQNAQLKLRKLTSTNFIHLYREKLLKYIEQLYSADVDAYNKAFSSLKRCCQKEFPFDHPYYWAGFISQGLA